MCSRTQGTVTLEQQTPQNIVPVHGQLTPLEVVVQGILGQICKEGRGYFFLGGGNMFS